jgi:hypothetical protein
LVKEFDGILFSELRDSLVEKDPSFKADLMFPLDEDPVPNSL